MIGQTYLDKRRRKVYAQRWLVSPNGQGGDPRKREVAKNRDLTVDEFINELMRPASKGFWSTCAVCGARVKDGNLARHMAKAHPKAIR